MAPTKPRLTAGQRAAFDAICLIHLAKTEPQNIRKLMSEKPSRKAA